MVGNIIESTGAQPLRALEFPLWGSRLIEASAGTGKTYTIAALYLRLVLGHGEPPEGRALTPPEILVVTFTRAATQELRDRIRSRLTQAALFFLEEDAGDAFLESLREEYEPAQWGGCARRLQLAAEWMDDAAISTIDAWCYRMLREHAFKSAGHFDVEMDLDDAENVAEATRDYWRLFVAPLDVHELAFFLEILTAHRLHQRKDVDCDSLAQVLQQRWLREGLTYPTGPSPAEMCRQTRQRLDALKQRWQAWLPDLRAVFEDAYDRGLYSKKALKVTVWRGCLDSLEKWVSDAGQAVPVNMKHVERLSYDSLKAIWEEGSPPQHPALFALSDLKAELESIPREATRIFQHAANWVGDRVEVLRRKRGTLGVSGLQRQLKSALEGPGGQELADAIRARFPAAMVDEFQDTSPLQYRLFDNIYQVQSNSRGCLLALIGDPKQAIYGFRGADIHAYLAARRACEGRLYTLTDNYRSAPAMVEAVNAVFEFAEHQNERGAFLFRNADAGNPVPFQPVNAAADPGILEIEGAIAPALTVWHDETFTSLEKCEEALSLACASEIHRLLELGDEGRAGIRRHDAFRPLKAGDIAVLVNTGKEATALRAALANRGIRSVYLSDDRSVYQGIAAQDVLSWLRACAEPENAGYVRAALASSGLDLHWDRLHALIRDDQHWESILEQFAGYKELWQRKGVLPMLRRLMQDFGVPARMLAEDGERREGERNLTDYLHLAELLQSASAMLDGEHAVIRYLEERIERGGEVDMEGDVSRMRLESDAALVQVVTVHKSKGLEYPLVFYPFAYYARRPDTSLKLPVVYRDRQGRERVVVNMADLDDTAQEEALQSLAHEQLAESVRKFYVALTRARHATWIGVASVSSLPRSAPGYLLGGAEACSPEALPLSLHAWADACTHISVQPFPEVHPGRYQASESETFTPVWRDMRRRITQRWALSSYSSLARMAVGHADPWQVHTEGASLALPDEPQLDIYLEAYAASEKGVVTEETTAIRGAAEVPEGIHAFPKGAGPGSFLHGLLERVFLQRPSVAFQDLAALNSWIARRCGSRGWGVHADILTQWLVDFCTREFRLPEYVGSVVLRPEARSRRRPLQLSQLDTFLPEMEFWFGAQEADLPALDALVSQHILPGLRRPRLEQGRFNGMLRGFVDLVFEHDGQFYVADYKSNWLGPNASFYDSPRITAAILEHRYDLQAALYLYALHKHLQSRLGDQYDYDRDVGGALIFFIRGHAAATQGLHIERPPRELMAHLEQIFEADAHEPSAFLERNGAH